MSRISSPCSSFSAFLMVWAWAWTAQVVQVTEAKQFTKCELAAVLQNKFELEPLADWVCIAEHESRLSTSFRKNGTNKCGLFGIDSKSWWNVDENNLNAVSGCRIECEDLVDDNISDDVQCAKAIFSLKGFQNWEKSWTKCVSSDLTTYLQECDIDTTIDFTPNDVGVLTVESRTGKGQKKVRGPVPNDLKLNTRSIADVNVNNESPKGRSARAGADDDCCTRRLRQDELDKIEMEFGGAVLRVIEIEKTVMAFEKAIAEHIEQELTRSEELELRLISTDAKLEKATNDLELARTQIMELTELVKGIIQNPKPAIEFTPPPPPPPDSQLQAVPTTSKPIQQPKTFGPGLDLGKLLKNTVHNVLQL